VSRQIRPRSYLAIWLVAAAIAWAAIAWLAVRLFLAVPRSAAFDLDLILGAGRSVAAGGSPYDPALIAGHAPRAVDLFFSYPPIVAQAGALVAGLPLALVFALWSTVAVALFAITIKRIAPLVGSATQGVTAVAAAVALAATTLPFIIAVLFGNLDALFPALYGLVLVAALSPRRWDGTIGGIAIAIGTLTKLYPAGLGLWFVVRAARDRGTPRGMAAVVVVATAVGAALVMVGISLAAFGLTPWQDYVAAAATAARADLVDGRNLAPAAQLALWLGVGNEPARILHLGVVAAALGITVAAAWFRQDPLESLSWAAAATLLLLPVAWIHYPAALMPFVAAAVLRADLLDAESARRVRRLAAAAIVMAAAALTWLPLLWLAVFLGLLAVNRSVPATAAPDAYQRETPSAAATVAEAATR
jgi:hypothetical protein